MQYVLTGPGGAMQFKKKKNQWSNLTSPGGAMQYFLKDPGGAT
jgi:hypothetical protein